MDPAASDDGRPLNLSAPTLPLQHSLVVVHGLQRRKHYAFYSNVSFLGSRGKLIVSSTPQT